MVCYRKYTHNLEDSKENTRKLTVYPTSSHTSLISETTKPKIMKKKMGI